MFSLHIDTARTWRGGQNQVLLTVNGLRSIGQRAALVAHPDGELRRRVRRRTRADSDRAANRNGPVGRLAARARGEASPARRHSRARSARRGHGVARAVARQRRRRRAAGRRRWWRRAASTFISRATRFRAGSIGRSTASSPPPKRSARCSSADGVPETKVVTVHEGIDVEHVLAAPPVNVHETFFLPHHAPVVGNVGALVPHKGQRHLIEAAHLVVQQLPDVRFVILGEGELREHLERLVREHHLEKHVLLPGFRIDVLGCIKGFDLFVMSSVTEGLGTSLLDAMACSKAIVATQRRRHSGSGRRRGERAARRASRSSRDGRSDRPADCRRTGRASEWPRPDSRACRERFTVERMVAETADRLRTRGRHTPRSGHCASRCARLKPQAFIIPRWHSEKSYFTGSDGIETPERRRDVLRHPPARARVASQTKAAADADHVRVERHDQLRRRDARPHAEIERSRRTIQRRNRLSRLHALPADGRGKK